MGTTSAVPEPTTISSRPAPSAKLQKNRTPRESCRNGGLFSLSRDAWGMLWKDLTCSHFWVKRTRALMVFESCWENVPMFSLVQPVWRGYRIITGIRGWGTLRDIKYFAKKKKKRKLLRIRKSAFMGNSAYLWNMFLKIQVTSSMHAFFLIFFFPKAKKKRKNKCWVLQMIVIYYPLLLSPFV